MMVFYTQDTFLTRTTHGGRQKKREMFGQKCNKWKSFMLWWICFVVSNKTLDIFGPNEQWQAASERPASQAKWLGRCPNEISFFNHHLTAETFDTVISLRNETNVHNGRFLLGVTKYFTKVSVCHWQISNRMDYI